MIRRLGVIVALLLTAPFPEADAFRATIGFHRDPCVSGIHPGTRCKSGTILVGAVGSVRYMTTPGGCTLSTTPVCDGSMDNLIGTRADTAAFCANLVYGGYSDWQLPERAVLDLLYQHQAVIGGFAPDFYWSSTESSSSPGYYYEVNMGTGLAFFYDGSDWNDYFRCVRPF